MSPVEAQPETISTVMAAATAEAATVREDLISVCVGLQVIINFSGYGWAMFDALHRYRR